MIKVAVNGYGIIGKLAFLSVYAEDDDGNVHKRVVPLKTKSTYLAELASLKYAIQCIANRDVDVEIETSVPHIASLFEKDDEGKWKKKCKTHVEFVDDIRNVSSEFRTFCCKYSKDSEMLQKVKSVVREQLKM